MSASTGVARVAAWRPAAEATAASLPPESEALAGSPAASGPAPWGKGDGRALPAGHGGAAGHAQPPGVAAQSAWWPVAAAVARREAQLAWARLAEMAWPVAFFIAVCALFPLALRPQPALLTALAPAVVWVAALLAVLMTAARHFDDDLRSGWLDQWWLAAQATGLPLAWQVAVRCGLHWAMLALPLLLAAPLVGLAYGLPWQALKVLMLTLALGSGVLVQWGWLAAALSAGLRAAGLLVFLIVLPLAAPVLVFGAAAVRAAALQLPFEAELALLGALAALSLAAGPWLTAAALRAAVQG